MRKSFIALIIFAIIGNFKASCQDYGKALQLNGETDYVSIGNMGTMPMEGSITLVGVTVRV
jgi:hypothetical protein